jgi:hypothetical protein
MRRATDDVSDGYGVVVTLPMVGMMVLMVGGVAWSGGLSAAVVKTVRSPSRRQACAKSGLEAEGEGFEPSIRLTTDNGLRDRYELVDLQGF